MDCRKVEAILATLEPTESRTKVFIGADAYHEPDTHIILDGRAPPHPRVIRIGAGRRNYSPKTIKTENYLSCVGKKFSLSLSLSPGRRLVVHGVMGSALDNH